MRFPPEGLVHLNRETQHDVIMTCVTWLILVQLLISTIVVAPPLVPYVVSRVC
jgi:hypothetical protein